MQSSFPENYVHPDEGDHKNIYIGIAKAEGKVYISCAIFHFICSFVFNANESKQPIVDVLTYMVNRTEDVQKRPFIESSDEVITASNINMNPFFKDAYDDGYMFFYGF